MIIIIVITARVPIAARPLKFAAEAGFDKARLTLASVVGRAIAPPLISPPGAEINLISFGYLFIASWRLSPSDTDHKKSEFTDKNCWDVSMAWLHKSCADFAHWLCNWARDAAAWDHDKPLTDSIYSAITLVSVMAQRLQHNYYN